VIIEGGVRTLQTFIDANLWDEAQVFKGQNSFTEGIKAPEFSGNLIREYTILKDRLLLYSF
jgi:diaminohydroxyphosphoribosylaminopyrimidine deaminase/5-amino-6-(5-phosphoribosylamino)uracil reductase